MSFIYDIYVIGRCQGDIMIDKKNNMIQKNINFPKDIWDRLFKAAEANGMKVSHLIRMFVMEGLRRMEKDD